MAQKGNPPKPPARPKRPGSKPGQVRDTDSQPSRRVNYEDGTSSYVPGRYYTTGGQRKTVNPEAKPKYPNVPIKGQTTGVANWLGMKGRDVTKKKPIQRGPAPKMTKLPNAPVDRPDTQWNPPADKNIASRSTRRSTLHTRTVASQTRSTKPKPKGR